MPRSTKKVFYNIFNSLMMMMVMPVMNFTFYFHLTTRNGDREEINRLRQVLTKHIKYVFNKPIELPTSWGLFHVLLRHTHECNGICSLEEATHLAGFCGIHDPKKVREVLHFFYTHFGTIFYFGDVPALEDIRLFVIPTYYFIQ